MRHVLLPRLRGTTALQVNNGYRSSGRPGGRRSLGAAEPDPDNVLLPRLQGTAALQVNNGYRSLERPGDASGLSVPPNPIRTMFCSRGWTAARTAALLWGLSSAGMLFGNDLAHK